MWRSTAERVRRPSGPVPDPSRRSQIIDLVLAAVLLGFALAVLVRADLYGGGLPDPKPLGLSLVKVKPNPGPVDYLCAVLVTVPLVWRRRYPLAVFWIVIGVLVAQPTHGAATTKLAACAIAAYTVAAHSPYRPAAIMSLGAAAAAIAGLYNNVLPTLPKVLGAFLVIVPIAAAGISMRGLRVRVADAQQREDILHRDRAQAMQLAIEQERARIARELHDVITHNVSVMLVQTGAARKIMTRDHGQATQALLAAESAGRAAMSELQHTMGLLAPDGDVHLAPQPGLNELDRLIDRVRETGLRVDHTETGTPRPLPAGADLAAYRVVQEALTNVAKHAAGAAAQVRVSYTAHEIVVEVGNGAGHRSPSTAERTGRGLIGLRQRVAACGGDLDVGPCDDGGFRVRAVIPLDDVMESV